MSNVQRPTSVEFHVERFGFGLWTLDFGRWTSFLHSIDEVGE